MAASNAMAPLSERSEVSPRRVSRYSSARAWKTDQIWTIVEVGFVANENWKEIDSSYSDWIVVLTYEVEKKPVSLPGTSKYSIKLKQ